MSISAALSGKSVRVATKEIEKATKAQRGFFQDFSKGALASTGKIWMAYAGNMAIMSAGFVAAATAAKSFNDAIDLQYLLKYSDAIGELAGNADGLGNNLSGMTDYIVSMRGVAAGPIELAEGMRELIKAGKTVDEIIGQDLVKSLSHFASVAEMDLATAIQLAVTQVNAFEAVTRDATGGLFDYADAADMMAAAVFNAPITFGDLAQSLKHTTELAVTVGASFDEITTALSLMGEAGIKGSQAGTAIRTALTKLVTPTSDLSTKIRILGGDLRDAFDEDGTMNVKNAIGLYKGMYDQLDSIAKVGFIKDVFGLRSQKAIAAMMKSFDNWDDRHTKILNSQQSIEKAYGKIRETVKVAGKEFMSAFSAEVMEELLPLMDKLPALIKSATENVDEIVDVLKIATAAATGFAAVWTTAKLISGIMAVQKALFGVAAANAAVAASGAGAAKAAGLGVAAKAGVAGAVGAGVYMLGSSVLESSKEHMEAAKKDIATLEKAIAAVIERIKGMKSSENFLAPLGLSLANQELDQLMTKLEEAKRIYADSGDKGRSEKELKVAKDKLAVAKELATLRSKSGTSAKYSDKDLEDIAAAEELSAKLKEKTGKIELEIELLGMPKYKKDIALVEAEAAKMRLSLADIADREQSVPTNRAIDAWVAAEKKKLETIRSTKAATEAYKEHNKILRETAKITKQANMSDIEKQFDDNAEAVKEFSRSLGDIPKDAILSERLADLNERTKAAFDVSRIKSFKTALKSLNEEMKTLEREGMTPMGIRKSQISEIGDLKDKAKEYGRAAAEIDQSSVEGKMAANRLLGEQVKLLDQAATAAKSLGTTAIAADKGLIVMAKNAQAAAGNKRGTSGNKEAYREASRFVKSLTKDTNDLEEAKQRVMDADRAGAAHPTAQNRSIYNAALDNYELVKSLEAAGAATDKLSVARLKMEYAEKKLEFGGRDRSKEISQSRDLLKAEQDLYRAGQMMDNNTTQGSIAAYKEAYDAYEKLYSQSKQAVTESITAEQAKKEKMEEVQSIADAILKAQIDAGGKTEESLNQVALAQGKLNESTGWYGGIWGSITNEVLAFEQSAVGAMGRVKAAQSNVDPGMYKTADGYSNIDEESMQGYVRSIDTAKGKIVELTNRERDRGKESIKNSKMVVDAISGEYSNIADQALPVVKTKLQLEDDAVNRVLAETEEAFRKLESSSTGINLHVSLENATAAADDYYFAVDDNIDIVKEFGTAAVEQLLEVTNAQLALNKATESYKPVTSEGLPGRALGGPVSAGQPYIVGEVGKELFIPNTSGTIIPNNKLGRASNEQESTVNLSINLGGTQMPVIKGSSKSSVDSFISELERAQRLAA